MIAHPRKLLIAIMVVVLAALNIWHWWPASVIPHGETRRTMEGIAAENFQIMAMPVNPLSPMSRDIFAPKKIAAPIKKKPATPKLLPTKPDISPEDMAKQSSQAEFSAIRCVGVSVRKGRMQAYLVISGEYS